MLDPMEETQKFLSPATEGVNVEAPWKGFSNLVERLRNQPDLTSQPAIDKFFETERPEYVFLAAAKRPRDEGAEEASVLYHHINHLRVIYTIM